MVIRSHIRIPGSGSLFHFHHRCGIGDFWRDLFIFINISHTVIGRFFAVRCCAYAWPTPSCASVRHVRVFWRNE